MSLPASREDFKQYCLRKLGKPVIDINVSDSQVEDRIDEAILFWQDFSTDGSERQLYKYQLTPTDFTNRYITLPDNIIGAVNIFDMGDIEGSAYMFNVRYQIALNDLYTLTSVSMVPYYMAYSHLQLLEQLLIGKKPIRYNRTTNRLYLDMDWSLWQPGNYVIVDSYQTIDPTTYTKMWSDRLLANLATALIKKNWGQILGKFSNVPMLGGVMMNGDQIYNSAVAEIQEIENKIRSDYETPADIWVG